MDKFEFKLDGETFFADQPAVDAKRRHVLGGCHK